MLAIVSLSCHGRLFYYYVCILTLPDLTRLEIFEPQEENIFIYFKLTFVWCKPQPVSVVLVEQSKYVQSVTLHDLSNSFNYNNLLFSTINVGVGRHLNSNIQLLCNYIY